MKKDLKEELLEFFAEAADPMSVKDVCMPDCKVIYEGGPVLYGPLAYKRQVRNEFVVQASKLGLNGFKMSNFKEGGTPKEPWCEFRFAFHNGEGFVYRKGKSRKVFKRIQGNLLLQSVDWTYDDLQRTDWNM